MSSSGTALEQLPTSGRLFLWVFLLSPCFIYFLPIFLEYALLKATGQGFPPQDSLYRN